jgi:hypothetical protein
MSSFVQQWLLPAEERSQATAASSPSICKPVDKNQAEPTKEQISDAVRTLNETGCRQWCEGAVHCVGVWSDLDGAEIRGAIATLGLTDSVIRFLDGDGVPLRFRLRHVPDRAPGEPFAAWLKRAAEKRRVA